MNENNERSSEEERGVVKRGFLGAGLAILLAASAFLSGLQIGNGSVPVAPMEAGLFSFLMPKPLVSDDADLTEFWKVWHLMEEKYVSATSTDGVSVEERIEGAIKGLVKSYGDPYTVFLPPTAASVFEEDISGNFGGVGMEVGLREGLVTVIAPLPNTPAALSGIVAGDVISDINGTSTEGMSIDEAVRLIRGEPGTSVTLELYREGEFEPLTKTIVRADIAIPTVDTELKGDVFVISLYSFNGVAESKMREALEEYARSGASKLVLDMRGNPGGFLQSAVSIGSYFIPAGKTVVSENFGNGKEEEIYRSYGKTLGEFMPDEMLVLVDGGSASASEILAGALQEHGVAKLLGEQTFGKGSVQELVRLEDGSSLKVTVARWFTPNGVSISEGGLTPDIYVERTPQQVIEGEDPQLEAAIKWLNGDKTVGSTTPTAAQ